MSERNLERATFLKSRRHRLTPEEVGLPRAGTRRRAATLRREDVAWLADVGITWYTWLEQGRPIKMAADTLDRVAVALRLDSSETEYLRKLVQTTVRERPPWESPVPERVRTLVESYEIGYAFVIGPRWDILTWNARAGELFALERRSGPVQHLERNGLWIMFTGLRTRGLFPNWEAVARRMVAMLRVKYADYTGDCGFAELIEKLTAYSEEFGAIWAEVDVLSPTRWSVETIRDGRSGEARAFETVSLEIPDAPGQTLVFFIPKE